MVYKNTWRVLIVMESNFVAVLEWKTSEKGYHYDVMNVKLLHFVKKDFLKIM